MYSFTCVELNYHSSDFNDFLTMLYWIKSNTAKVKQVKAFLANHLQLEYGCNSVEEFDQRTFKENPSLQYLKEFNKQSKAKKTIKFHLKRLRFLAHLVKQVGKICDHKREIVNNLLN